MALRDPFIDKTMIEMKHFYDHFTLWKDQKIVGKKEKYILQEKWPENSCCSYSYQCVGLRENKLWIKCLDYSMFKLSRASHSHAFENILKKIKIEREVVYKKLTPIK